MGWGVNESSYVCDVCQSHDEQLDRQYARHVEFHAASRIVNMERAWAIEPEKYEQVRRAGEAVRATQYTQRSANKRVEDTREI